MFDLTYSAASLRMVVPLLLDRCARWGVDELCGLEPDTRAEIGMGGDGRACCSLGMLL